MKIPRFSVARISTKLSLLRTLSLRILNSLPKNAQINENIYNTWDRVPIFLTVRWRGSFNSVDTNSETVTGSAIWIRADLSSFLHFLNSKSFFTFTSALEDEREESKPSLPHARARGYFGRRRELREASPHFPAGIESREYARQYRPVPYDNGVAGRL